jgi:hypothetical protein
VVVEDAQAALDVIIGMIFVNDNNAIVLSNSGASHSFNDNNAIVLSNSGASHSFVVASFVQKYNLPLSMLKNRMIVSSPRGDMHARHVLIRGGRILSQPHSFGVKRNWRDSWNGLAKQT